MPIQHSPQKFSLKSLHAENMSILLLNLSFWAKIYTFMKTVHGHQIPLKIIVHKFTEIGRKIRQFGVFFIYKPPGGNFLADFGGFVYDNLQWYLTDSYSSVFQSISKKNVLWCLAHPPPAPLNIKGRHKDKPLNCIGNETYPPQEPITFTQRVIMPLAILFL